MVMKISSFFLRPPRREGNVFPTGFFGMKSNNPAFLLRNGKWMNFSSLVKVGLVFAIFCVLQNAGLPNSATPPNYFHHSHFHRHRNVTTHPSHLHHHVPSPSDLITQTSHLSLQDEPFRLDPLEGEEDTYDPVEAYHQLRRHYLTSTSRVDRAHYGIGGGNYPSPSGQTRHHTHSTNHHHNNYHDTGSSDRRDNNNRNRNDNGRSYGQIRGESGPHSHSSPLNRQRCYVCLPPNRVSREAKDILAMFGREDPREIADCAEFTPENANSYEFNCPPGFGGCLNVSRACSKYRLNDCKKANSVEFCYCTEPLCNDVKPVPLPLSPRDDDLDDDEDSRAGGGSGERSVSNKEEEVPSDSELVHTPSNDKNRKDSSVALANFDADDDTANSGEDDDDVRSLKDGGGGDLKNLNSSSALGKSGGNIFLLVTLAFLLVWRSDISENLMPFCGRAGSSGGLHFS
ncbi:hypothetical protein Fcan01_14057 [Folsomia candida]|uniref:Uncharacterized protein n=1 Tax=Folsomia candida TaxID=158441 RepID=A0A226E111_FOLCA|nr:hypothetical protein Fcan01_14057 [Folsomia candida]